MVCPAVVEGHILDVFDHLSPIGLDLDGWIDGDGVYGVLIEQKGFVHHGGQDIALIGRDRLYFIGMPVFKRPWRRTAGGVIHDQGADRPHRLAGIRVGQEAARPIQFQTESMSIQFEGEGVDAGIPFEQDLFLKPVEGGGVAQGYSVIEDTLEIHAILCLFPQGNDGSDSGCFFGIPFGHRQGFRKNDISCAAPHLDRGILKIPAPAEKRAAFDGDVPAFQQDTGVSIQRLRKVGFHVVLVTDERVILPISGFSDIGG